jgi:recombination protein RecA
MLSAATLRIQVEDALSARIPSALTPAPRVVRPVAPTGIHAVDELLHGGLPVGAITEIIGPECSGRTALALSFIARITDEEKACAWIDVLNSLHPESAAAAGIHLPRMLWVRCGIDNSSSAATDPRSFSIPDGYFAPPVIKRGLHGGGFGPHPRSEVKGLSEAVRGLLSITPSSARYAESQRRVRPQGKALEAEAFDKPRRFRRKASKPLSRIGQALRVTDLLLQAGGFSAIVLDLGGIAPEDATRVPAATWFRYRAAAERTQACIVLLTQHKCAQSSAGLALRMTAGPSLNESTVFTGINHQVEILRERFPAVPTNVVPLRKPPQSERQTEWQSRATWAGYR